MNLINDKIHNIKTISNDINKYAATFTKISNDISQMVNLNVDIVNEINKIEQLSNITTESNDLKKALKPESDKPNDPELNLKILNEAFNIINIDELIIFKINVILNELIRINRITPESLLKEKTINADYCANVSECNSLEVHIKKCGDMYNNITKIYNTYKKDKKDSDITLFKHVSSLYITELNKDTANINITLFNDLVKLFPFSVNLYAYLMQSMLLKCIPFGDHICNNILNNIELIKDYILLHGSNKGLSDKIIYKNNPHIKTFGLTPTGYSKDLHDLTTEIFKKSVKIESKLESLADDKKICIIILNKVIEKPLEFTVWNLIDWDYGKLYTQIEFSGINQKTIDKFNIVKYIPIKKPQKWDFSVNSYGDIESSHFIIIEKLSNDVYRLLNIYDPKSSLLTISQYDPKIHKSRIAAFIEFVKNKGVVSINTRVSMYHNIQESNIIKNMFLPIKFNTKSISINSQIVESIFLKNDIRIKLTDVFTNIIKTDFKDGTLIKTNKDFSILIHDDKLSILFINILIDQYDQYISKDKNNDNNFTLSETFKTFIAELDLIRRSFDRTLHSKFIELHTPPLIYKYDNNNKKKYLTQAFIDIITFVLNKIITTENNIFQSVIYKNSLINLSIV